MATLTPAHITALAERYITPEIAQRAGLYSVDNVEGSQKVGRKHYSADYSGIFIPNMWPGEPERGSGRLRRDNPDIEYDKNGKPKEKNKYLVAPGSRNKTYIPPVTPIEYLMDETVPVWFTEGEFKSLALKRYVEENNLRILVIAISGVENWRGVIGRTIGSNGEWIKIKGVITDFDRIKWTGRTVTVMFDSDIHSNWNIRRARWQLSLQLIDRGADCWYLNLPEGQDESGVKKLGVDDFLYSHGPKAFSELLSQSIPSEKKPQIEVNRQLSDVLPDSWDAVIRANNPPRVFRSYRNILRVVESQDQTYTEEVNKDIMSGLLFRAADWISVTEKGTKPSKPPKEIILDCVVNPSEELPELEAIVTSPVFSQQGELITASGYHPLSKIYYPPTQSINIPSIHKNPSRKDINQALSLICLDMLGDFPFVSQADLANTVATLLEPFVRLMIRGVRPMRAIDAPDQGHGKGLLSTVIQILPFGGQSKATTVPDRRDEWKKLITSLLLSSPQVIFFDNVRGKIDSQELDMALTMPIWEDRILGESRVVALPNKALWLCTGNNLQFAGDLPRRVIPIRLDAKTDRAWERTGFKHKDLIGWITENRSTLIHACLTLVQAWISEGKPLAEKALGSFESWSTIMGGILKVAGIEGFLCNLERLYKTADIERDPLREFVAAWDDVFGTLPKSAGSLNNLCESKDLLNHLRGDGSPKSQQTRLGYKLNQLRDKVFTIGEEDGKPILRRIVQGIGTDEKGNGNRTLYHLADPSTVPVENELKTFLNSLDHRESSHNNGTNSATSATYTSEVADCNPNYCNNSATSATFATFPGRAACAHARKEDLENKLISFPGPQKGCEVADEFVSLADTTNAVRQPAPMEVAKVADETESPMDRKDNCRQPFETIVEETTDKRILAVDWLRKLLKAELPLTHKMTLPSGYSILYPQAYAETVLENLEENQEIDFEDLRVFCKAMKPYMKEVL